MLTDQNVRNRKHRSDFFKRKDDSEPKIVISASESTADTQNSWADLLDLLCKPLESLVPKDFGKKEMGILDMVKGMLGNALAATISPGSLLGKIILTSTFNNLLPAVAATASDYIFGNGVGPDGIDLCLLDGYYEPDCTQGYVTNGKINPQVIAHWVNVVVTDSNCGRRLQGCLQHIDMAEVMKAGLNVSDIKNAIKSQVIQLQSQFIYDPDLDMHALMNTFLSTTLPNFNVAAANDVLGRLISECYDKIEQHCSIQNYSIRSSHESDTPIWWAIGTAVTCCILGFILNEIKHKISQRSQDPERQPLLDESTPSHLSASINP